MNRETVIDWKLWQVGLRMPNSARELPPVPIKTRIFLLGVDARSMLVIELSSKARDAEDVNWRVWKVQYILD